jgi:hypothetical protein
MSQVNLVGKVCIVFPSYPLEIHFQTIRVETGKPIEALDTSKLDCKKI